MLTYSKFYSGVVLSELSGSENLSARSVYVELLFRRPKSDVFYTNEINVKDLAETSGLEQPTVYKTIKKLIAKGIIVKVYPHEKSAGIFYVEFPLEKQAHDAFMAEQRKEKEKPTYS